MLYQLSYRVFWSLISGRSRLDALHPNDGRVALDAKRAHVPAVHRIGKGRYLHHVGVRDGTGLDDGTLGAARKPDDGEGIVRLGNRKRTDGHERGLALLHRSLPV